ncbi:MAG: hypothetical protein HUJ70_03295 [Pseudobutyrivibrio sp.]|nr:hypothetical protein [Pseudobutyrivibrio sp.]
MTSKELHRLGKMDLIELLLRETQEVAVLKDQLAASQDEVKELTDMGERLKEKLADKDMQLATLKDRLDDKDEKIENVKSIVADRDLQIEHLVEKLDEKDAKIDRLKRRILKIDRGIIARYEQKKKVQG